MHTHTGVYARRHARGRAGAREHTLAHIHTPHARERVRANTRLHTCTRTHQKLHEEPIPSGAFRNPTWLHSSLFSFGDSSLTIGEKSNHIYGNAACG